MHWHVPFLGVVLHPEVEEAQQVEKGLQRYVPFLGAVLHPEVEAEAELM